MSTAAVHIKIGITATIVLMRTATPLLVTKMHAMITALTEITKMRTLTLFKISF